MASLIDKIRAARQSVVEIDNISYTISRPTDMDVLTWQGKTDGDILRKFVINWSGVNEIDLIPGGSPTPVQFETELFIESIADKPDHVALLAKAIVDSYKAHIEAREQAQKKTQTTLTPQALE
jgi:hypothetical protein